MSEQRSKEQSNEKHPADDPVDLHDCDHAWVYSNFTATECLWCGVKKSTSKELSK